MGTIVRCLDAWWVGVAMALLVVSIGVAQEEQAAADLVGEGDQLEFLADQNLAIYRGNVRLQYQDTTLLADEVQVNRETMDVEAVGNVRILQERGLASGDHVTGNMRREEYEFSTFSGYFDEWLFKGSGAHRYPDGRYVIRDAAITTCEDWWLHAKEVERMPDGTYVARNVVWKVNGVPLMYLPRLSGNTNEDNARWEFGAGHQSDWGFYARLGRTWQIGEAGTSELALWYRTERGFALEHNAQLASETSETDIHAYGMLDQDPLTDRLVGNTWYNNRFEAEEERYRLRLYHRQELQPSLTFRGNFDAISDNDLLLEFYRDEYNTYPEPATFANLTWMQERYILSANLRPRINDFYTSVERIPDIRLEMPRQSILGSGLYYQSATSLAHLRTSWRDYDLPRDDNATFTDYDSWRFDTLHMLYYPLKADWLNIVPRAGVRYTHYSDSSRTGLTDMQIERSFSADDRRAEPDETAPIFNFDDDGGSLGRTLFELGMEVSFKTSRAWQAPYSRRWGIDGLRHVVEPYINYTMITDPDDRQNIYYFDDVDRIPETNLLRVGVEQRLQTRRDKRVYTLARLENYVDFHFDPQEQELDHTGEVGTLFSLHPTDSFTLWINSLIDAGDLRMNVLNIGTTYKYHDRWAVGLAYLLRNDYRSRYVTSMGSDLTQVISETIPHAYDENHNIQLSFRFHITPSLQFETRHYVDLEAGDWGRQVYELSRHGECWITALRLEEDGDDVQIVLLLTLKDIGRLRAGG